MPLELLLINTAMLLAAAFGCLVLGAFILNELPLQDPPGLLFRLKQYLTRNVAETRRGSVYPELELRSYQIAPRALFARVEHAVEVLGWRIVDADPAGLTLRAEVESRLFRFVDDVQIQLRVGDAGTELYVRAKSRVGRGDLGTNTRHVMNLHSALARQV